MGNRYWMIVDEKNNPAVLCRKLPIYWLKWVAKNVCKEYPNYSVIEVEVKPKGRK